MCVCVCECFLGSGAVTANVLPLEQICGLLGQMGLTIASSPKTEHTVLQGSMTPGEHRLKMYTKLTVDILPPLRCVTDNSAGSPAQKTRPVSVLDSFFSTARVLASNMSCPWSGRGSPPATHKAGQKTGAAVTSHPVPVALMGGAHTHLYLRREASVRVGQILHDTATI